MKPTTTHRIPRLMRVDSQCVERTPRRSQITQVEHCEESLIFSTMQNAVALFFSPAPEASRQAKAIFNLRIKKLKCKFGNFTNIRKALSKQQQKLKASTGAAYADTNDVVNPNRMGVEFLHSKSRTQIVAASWDPDRTEERSTNLDQEDENLKVSETQNSKASEPRSLDPNHTDVYLSGSCAPEGILNEQEKLNKYFEKPSALTGAPENYQNKSRRSLHVSQRPRNPTGRFFRAPNTQGNKEVAFAEAVTDSSSVCSGVVRIPAYCGCPIASEHFKWSATLSSHHGEHESESSLRTANNGDPADSHCWYEAGFTRPLIAGGAPGFGIHLEPLETNPSAICESTHSNLQARTLLPFDSSSMLGLITCDTVPTFFEGSFWEQVEHEVSFTGILEHFETSRNSAGDAYL